MNKSESIKELAAALCKAQAEIRGAIKDSKNPFFKSSYADLESVWEACRVPLTKHGLSVSQLPASNERGPTLETVLMHSSGEWISSCVDLAPAKNDPQGVGSALSYFRRYSLAAIVGIVQTDDDGEAASGRTPGVDAPEIKSVTQVASSAAPKAETVYAKTAPTCCGAVMLASQYHNGWYCRACKARAFREGAAS